MTENEKGWGYRSKNKEDITLSADEPLPVEEAVVEEPVVEEQAVEEPVVVAPVTSAEKEKAAIEAAIKRARASAAAKQAPADDRSGAKAEILAEKQKALQNKIDSLYTTGVWGGKPNYECSKCSFSTLDETLIRQHVVKHV